MDDIYSVTVIYREHLPELIRQTMSGDSIAHLTLDLVSTVTAYATHLKTLPCGLCQRDMRRVAEVGALGLAIPQDDPNGRRAVVALLCDDCARQDWPTQRAAMLDLLSTHFHDVRILNNVHSHAGHA